MIMTNLEKANQVSQELVGLALHLCGLDVCPQN